MPAKGRIAYVGTDRQIHVVDPDGRDRRPVTFSKAPSALTRWGGSAGQDAAAWPCWSPDGRWIACFQMVGEEMGVGPNLVTAVEVDGVEERGLLDLQSRQAICAAWSPRGDRLAVLVDSAGDLELLTVRRDGEGSPESVAKGSPLFFTWTPDGARLLLHLGGRGESRSRLAVVEPGGPLRPLPDPPGSFCTPLYAGARAVYVTSHLGAGWVSVADPDLQRSVALTFFEGLLAVVPSPLGGQLAVGAAPSGEGTPYGGVWRVPLDGGSPEQVIDDPCLAFFWDPKGRHLIYACLDQAAGSASWRLAPLDGGPVRELATFWPSRDLLFHLHFFEQFTNSHALLSPDGATLLYAGYASSAAAGRSPCRVFTLNLDVPGAQPNPVAEGTYAVFSPA